MWLAQGQSPPAAELIQYGALGVVLIGLLLGWLWPRPAVDRLLQDKDRVIAERDRMIAEHTARIDTLAAEVRELRSEIHDLAERVRRDP